MEEGSELVSGYHLEGVDGEICLVIRSYNEELIYSIIKRLSKMRQRDIKKLGTRLEEEFNERF